VKKMVEVFREAKRILRDDGTLWLNLGDTYATTSGGMEQLRKLGGQTQTTER
jgi:DNA modification methylase